MHDDRSTVEVGDEAPDHVRVLVRQHGVHDHLRHAHTILGRVGARGPAKHLHTRMGAPLEALPLGQHRQLPSVPSSNRRPGARWDIPSATALWDGRSPRGYWMLADYEVLRPLYAAA